MKNKIIVSILVIIFFILAIVLLINANENTNEILAKKTTYEYPYKTVIKVNKNGGIYKSKIIDELTKEGPPKDKFSKVGTITNEDLITIEEIINEMKEEQKKSSNSSESYGLAVNIGDSSLYGCEYFSQENVDKLNINTSKVVNLKRNIVVNKETPETNQLAYFYQDEKEEFLSEEEYEKAYGDNAPYQEGNNKWKN